MRILITAGPTREAIDPVRFLSNRSSGKMGYALAMAAVENGHEVTLISGPVALDCPDGVGIVPVESALQMFEAVQARIAAVDVAIMAAAVSDYRPVQVADEKLKKSTRMLTLELEPTADILASARSEFAFKGLLVGFAAETSNIDAYAKDKLRSKRCDAIVANDVSAPGIGFDSHENVVTVYFDDGSSRKFPRCSKTELGRKLIALIEKLATDKSAHLLQGEK